MGLTNIYNRKTRRARIFGMDNAHAIKSSKKETGKYKGRTIGYDHIHQFYDTKTRAYAFKNAEQLLQDFFEEVNKILNKVNRR